MAELCSLNLHTEIKDEIENTTPVRVFKSATYKAGRRHQFSALAYLLSQGEHTTPKKEQERNLALRAQKGDEKAKTNLLKLLTPTLKTLAESVHKDSPDVGSVDDLLQTGMVALLEHLDTFEPEKNIPFVAYARHGILGAMLKDHFLARSLVPTKNRKVQKAYYHMARTEKNLPVTECAHHFTQDDGEIFLSKKLNITRAHASKAAQLRYKKDTRFKTSDAAEICVAPEMPSARKALLLAITRSLRSIPNKRDRKIISTFLIRSITETIKNKEIEGSFFSDCAEQYNLTDTRVRQIVRAGKADIQRRLAAQGLDATTVMELN